jgi:hypothetical protein
MKASEILRKLADYIDAQEAESSAEDLAKQPDDIFIPPLQLKLELLKKATGVENVYDEEAEEQAKQHAYDELNAIKKNAGINIVALDALGDDEPLDV